MSFLLQYHFTTGEESDPNNCYDWWSCLSLSAQHTLAGCSTETGDGQEGKYSSRNRKGATFHLFSLHGAGCWTSMAEAPGDMCPKSYMLVHRVILRAAPLHYAKKNSLSLKTCNSAPHHCYYMHSYLAVSSICLFKFLAIWTLLKSWNCNCSDH